MRRGTRSLMVFKESPPNLLGDCFGRTDNSLAMTITGEGCARAAKCAAQVSPIKLVCHCEPRTVRRGNLQHSHIGDCFGRTDNSLAMTITGECCARAATYAAQESPIKLVCHCEPRWFSGRGNLQHSHIGDCFGRTGNSLAMTYNMFYQCERFM